MTSEVDAPYVEDTKTAKHFSYQERTDEQHREALKETFGDGNLKVLRSSSTGAYSRMWPSVDIKNNVKSGVSYKIFGPARRRLYMPKGNAKPSGRSTTANASTRSSKTRCTSVQMMYLPLIHIYLHSLPIILLNSSSTSSMLGNVERSFSD